MIKDKDFSDISPRWVKGFAWFIAMLGLIHIIAGIFPVMHDFIYVVMPVEQDEHFNKAFSAVGVSWIVSIVAAMKQRIEELKKELDVAHHIIQSRYN